jgi:hypothetical protein
MKSPLTQGRSEEGEEKITREKESDREEVKPGKNDEEVERGRKGVRR